MATIQGLKQVGNYLQMEIMQARNSGVKANPKHNSEDNSELTQGDSASLCIKFSLEGFEYQARV